MGSLPITAEANTPGLFLGPHGIGTVDLCHTANCEVTLLIFRTVRPPRVHFALLCQVFRGKTQRYYEPIFNRRTSDAEYWGVQGRTGWAGSTYPAHNDQITVNIILLRDYIRLWVEFPQGDLAFLRWHGVNWCVLNSL